MQCITEISQECSRSAWAMGKAVISGALRAYAILTGPLVAIAFLLSLLVGGEAWTPLWFYLEGSTPLCLQVVFWALIPSVLFALASAMGWSCVAWCRYIPEAYSPQIKRARRYSQQVAVAWVTAKLHRDPCPRGRRGRLRTSSLLASLPAMAHVGLSTSIQLLE